MEKIVGSSRDRAHAAGVKLDTSGFVRSHDPLPMARVFHWSDLDPFTQGYIEALFEDRFEQEDGKPWPCKAFRYLAPETLARIMADCAWGSDWKVCARRGYTPSANGGALFWKERQAGKWVPLRPLRPCLADDGRVYTPEDRLTIIADVDGEILPGGRHMACDTICVCEDEDGAPSDPFCRPDLTGIFRDHACWRCNDGAKPCAQGHPNRCDYPHARND